MFASILSSFVLYLVLYFVLLLLCLPFFLSSLLLLLSLFLLSSACPLGCLASDLGLVFSLCGLLLFPFPLRMYGQKKGRTVLVRPLWVFCFVVQILVTLSKNSVAVALAFSSSFGLYSQLIQQESEGLPVLTLIRSGIMSI